MHDQSYSMNSCDLSRRWVGIMLPFLRNLITLICSIQYNLMIGNNEICYFDEFILHYIKILHNWNTIKGTQNNWHVFLCNCAKYCYGTAKRNHSTKSAQNTYTDNIKYNCHSEFLSWCCFGIIIEYNLFTQKSQLKILFLNQYVVHNMGCQLEIK